MALVVVKTKIDTYPNSGSGFDTESYLIEIQDVPGPLSGAHVYDTDSVLGVLFNLSFFPTWVEVVGVCCHSKPTVPPIFDSANVGVVAECVDSGPPIDPAGTISYRITGSPSFGTGRVQLYLTNGGLGNGDLYFIKLHLGRTHSIMD